VLDSFLGSGTTLLAAERTGRICRGIELDPLYIDTAILEQSSSASITSWTGFAVGCSSSRLLPLRLWVLALS